MKDYDRMLRVNELLKREIGALCERYVSPRIDSLLTVTAVDTAVDLHRAKVSVSVMGSAEQQQFALDICMEYRRDFQKHLAKNVRLKYTPVLNFELDDTPRKADEVLAILDDIEEDDAAEDSS